MNTAMRLAIILLALLFVSNFFSFYYQWYMEYWWFDTVQHFLGGFFVAMLVWAYFKDYLPRHTFNNLVLLTGAVVLVGVVWEFAEYIANQILVEPIYRYWQIRSYFIGDLEDTLMDLCLDTSGAVLYLTLHPLWKRNAHKA